MSHVERPSDFRFWLSFRLAHLKHSAVHELQLLAQHGLQAPPLLSCASGWVLAWLPDSSAVSWAQPGPAHCSKGLSCHRAKPVSALTAMLLNTKLVRAVMDADSQAWEH